MKKERIGEKRFFDLKKWGPKRKEQRKKTSKQFAEL